MKVRESLKGYINSRYPNWDITIALRYLPIVEDLKRTLKKGETVLELGSEITGITTYYQIPVTGLDTSFDMSRKNKYLKPVKGSVLKIPFKDSSFDYCLSVDMLEHIPPKLRDKAISEMVRVTKKKLYLSFPTGEAAEKIDQGIREYHLRKHGEDYPYLKEHVEFGLPDEEKVKKALQKYGGAKLRVYKNTNLTLWNTLLRWGLSREQLKSSLYRRLLILLPVLRRINFGTTYRKLYILEKD